MVKQAIFMRLSDNKWHRLASDAAYWNMNNIGIHLLDNIDIHFIVINKVQSQCVLHTLCSQNMAQWVFIVQNQKIWWKEMFLVQSCLLIDNPYKPISLQYSWLSVEQPIRIDWVLYKRCWEFPINKKIIPMLTCPIFMYAEPICTI